MSLSECLLGVHGREFHVAFALLSLGRLKVKVGDVVASLGDITLDCLPGLSDLIISMMVWQIKNFIIEADLLPDLYKRV